MTLIDTDPGLDLPRITTAFQPLVTLETGDVVGFEALTRGPGADPSPVPLLRRAAASGRLVEFDDHCRRSAVDAAVAAELPRGLTWFLNTEPAGLARDANLVLPDDHGLPIALEITERALTNSPRSLMAAAEQVHERNWLLAVDDVGANPESLSLLPLIRPDVVKLDMSVVQDHRRLDSAAVANAVRAYAEDTGATVLAEGIETQRHIEIAKAYGATHGQGYFFGRPGPLPASLPDVGSPFVRAMEPDGSVATTPWQLASARRVTQVSTKGLLISISRQLEWQALNAGAAMVMVISIQDRRFWTHTMRALYAELVDRNVFTGVVGVDVPVDLQYGVRGSGLDAADPLANEWNVLVVGPYQCAALTAVDLGDENVPDADRRFEYLVTYERDLVTAMTRSLFHRLSEKVDSDDEVLGWA